MVTALKFFFLFYFLCSLSLFSQSQAPPPREYIRNHMFWFNFVAIGKIKNKFTYQLDLDLRRQADPSRPNIKGSTIPSDRYNIFKNQFQEVLKPWIHFTPNKKLRLSWSPIAWAGTWTNPENGVVIYQPEFRTCPQVTLYDIYGKLNLQHRFRYEYRFNGLKDTVSSSLNPLGDPDTYQFPATKRHHRFRYQLKATLPLNGMGMMKGTTYLIVSGEIFLKAGKNIQNIHLLDQTRFHLGLGWKVGAFIRIEGGFLQQSLFRFDNAAKNNINSNNNLFVNIIFEDFNRLFQTSKE